MHVMHQTFGRVWDNGGNWNWGIRFPFVFLYWSICQWLQMGVLHWRLWFGGWLIVPALGLSPAWCRRWGLGVPISVWNVLSYLSWNLFLFLLLSSLWVTYELWLLLFMWCKCPSCNLTWALLNTYLINEWWTNYNWNCQQTKSAETTCGMPWVK